MSEKTTEVKDSHLQPTPIIDSGHERVRAFALEHAGKSNDKVEQAVGLYYAVRDLIRYNPYTFSLTVETLKASSSLTTGEAWCVPKAALLAACCRAMGIPSRVGFADVRNHLSTKRMREMMKTDVFHWHGYTLLYLEGKWVKATPAFNRELCERFNFKTLDFDGTHDSLYHPFDLDGKKHMEYLHFRGEYDDVPIDEMKASIQELYGSETFDADNADFDKETERLD